MNIERYINDVGEFRCFGVSNRGLSRVGMVKVLSALDGVNVRHHPTPKDYEMFCEFELSGKQFEISEAYGDNSYFDVVSPEANLDELEFLARHFEESDPIGGGDFSRDSKYLVGFSFTPLIIICLGCGIYVGFKWLIS